MRPFPRRGSDRVLRLGTLLMGTLVTGFALASCGSCREERPSVAPPATREIFPLVVAPRPIGTPEAFDLVRVHEGAALVWSPPFLEGGGVRILRLDPHGTPSSEERGVYSPRAHDRTPPDAFVVSAAAGGGRLAVAWVERAPFARAIQATHGPDTGEAFAPIEDLIELGLDTSPGGAVAVAASEDGTLSVMFRTPDTPCPTGVGASRVGQGCARIRMRRIGTTTDETGGRGSGLAIPDACDRPLLGYLWASRTWHYTVCSSSGDALRTTAYAIAFDPEYAHAEETLVGCEPAGLGPVDDGVIALGVCDGRLDGLVMRDSGRELELLRSIERALHCEEGVPAVELRGRQRSVRWELPGPVDRIEHLLPVAIAPPGSRAVWTGEALLVAVAEGGEVVTRRYQCRGGTPIRTDLL